MPEVLYPRLPSGFATHDVTSCDRLHWQDLVFSACMRNMSLARLLCSKLLTRKPVPTDPPAFFEWLQQLDGTLTLRTSMNLPRSCVLLIMILAYRHFPNLYRECFYMRVYYEQFTGVERRPPRKTARPL